MSHTPGPWDIRRMPDWNNKGGQHFAAYCFFNMPPIRDEDEANANARLIAASPDLLAALKGILESGSFDDDGDFILYHEEPLPGHEDDDYVDPECIKIAREAIAKAEGR